MNSQRETKLADQRIVQMLRSEIVRLCDAGRFMQAEKRIEDLAAVRCGDIFAETHWERVCKWFLETDPVYRTQHCLFGGVPSKRSVTDESCTIRPSGSGTSTLVCPA